ncbi:MAG: hypothetical protein ACREFD_08510 [Stellaceae bacterium]
MNRILRVAALAAIFLFGLAAVAVPSHAADLAAIQKAANQLIALGANAYKTGQAPRMTDPKVRTLLRAAYDVSDVPANGPTSSKEMQELGKQIRTVTRVGLVYTLAGTGYRSFQDAAKTKNLDKLNAQVNRNAVTYAAEMAGYYDAGLVVYGAMVKGVASQVEAKSLTKAKVAGFAQSAARYFVNVVKTLTIPGLSDGWQRDRMPGLIGMAPNLAKLSSPKLKADIRGALLTLAGRFKDPVLKAGIAGLADEFAG